MYEYWVWILFDWLSPVANKFTSLSYIINRCTFITLSWKPREQRYLPSNLVLQAAKALQDQFPKKRLSRLPAQRNFQTCCHQFSQPRSQVQSCHYIGITKSSTWSGMISKNWGRNPPLPMMFCILPLIKILQVLERNMMMSESKASKRRNPFEDSNKIFRNTTSMKMIFQTKRKEDQVK